MLGMCGLRRQRLTFLAKSRTLPSSAPPGSIHLGLSLLICKMGRTPPPSQDRDESPCRGEAPAAEKPAPTPHPNPCPLPPLHHAREESVQVGPWPWSSLGASASPWGGITSPPTPPSPPSSPLRSLEGWLSARLRSGPRRDGTPLGLAGPGQAETRATHTLQGRATRRPWGRGGALGRTAKASGGLRTRERVGEQGERQVVGGT